MEAIILAGGLGTRLRGVVDNVPKPMAPVLGRPFLSFVLDQLLAAGVRTAILAVGYRHEAIRAYFGDAYRGIDIRYSIEDEPLGTGGAIRLASTLAVAPEVFVLNGDTYLELDFRGMLDAHLHAKAQLTLAVSQVADVARYGALEIREGIVRSFREKGQSGGGWINAGVYLLGSALRQRLPAQHRFSFEQNFLVPEVESIQPLAFPTSGLFIDIGIPDDYERAQQVLAPRGAG